MEEPPSRINMRARARTLAKRCSYARSPRRSEAREGGVQTDAVAAESLAGRAAESPPQFGGSQKRNLNGGEREPFLRLRRVRGKENAVATRASVWSHGDKRDTGEEGAPGSNKKRIRLRPGSLNKRSSIGVQGLETRGKTRATHCPGLRKCECARAERPAKHKGERI